MDRKTIFISIAIILLFAIYLTFSELYYFNPILFVIFNLMALASALLLFFGSRQKPNPKTKKKSKIKMNNNVLAVIVMFFLLIGFQLVGLAVIISILGILGIGIVMKKSDSRKAYALAMMLLLVVAALSYISISTLRGNWKGVDEVAFNYYASYLLLHGVNPYTASMQPIIAKYNTTPTILLNGSYEYRYDYPALSFLPVLPLPLIIDYSQLHSFLSFVAIVVFLSVISAFIIYKKSNYNNSVLVPLAVWLLATYLLVATIDHYLAVALFLLIAYLERKNVVLSSIFLGLAASTIQLAWFALPFFYILTLREHGKKVFVQSILVSLLIFVLANSYFLVLSPKAFLNSSLLVFGTSKLLPYGANIFQIFMAYYPVPFWCSAIISVIAFLSMMLLFYLYTSTLRPLFALAPLFIFFFAWRNLTMYGLAFIPLVIAVAYLDVKEFPKDAVKSKNYLYLIIGLAAVLIILLIAYSHASYAKANILYIDSATPILHKLPNATNNASYMLSGINITVSNNNNMAENVSFAFINYNPDKDKFVSSLTLNSIAAHSKRDYILPFNVNAISANAKIYILAFSKDYLITKEININTTDSHSS